jgi:adenylate kinase family enzyme
MPEPDRDEPAAVTPAPPTPAATPAVAATQPAPLAAGGEPALRLHLIGCSGAGKTTLGRALAGRLGLAFVDLDELFWEPGWRDVGHAELTRRLAPTLLQPGWVVVGNYGPTTEPHVWPLLTHLLVLDLPYALLMRRTLWRTLRRAITRERFCNGNQESLLRLLHRDGLVRYLARTWARRHARFQRLAADPGHEPALAQATVLRFEHNPSVDEALALIAAGTARPPG